VRNNSGDSQAGRTDLRRDRLVGRDRELEMLVAELSLARSGVRLVVFEATGGMGKTALLDAFCWQANTHDDVTVVRVQGVGLDNLPLTALVDAFGVLDQKADRVPDGWQFAMNFQARWQEALFVEMEKRTLRNCCLIVAIDDAHLLDTASCEFILSCQQLLAGLPVLIVCMHRPLPVGVTTLRRIREHADEFERLDTLAEHDMLDIARMEYGEVLPHDLAFRVANAGGRPLFAREFARALLRQPAGLGPASLDAIVGDELDRLPADCRTVVLAAAVLGRSIETAEIANMTGLREATVASSLRNAALAGLLDLDPTPAFVHDVVRDCCLATMGELERTALHRDAAEMLRRLDGPVERIVGHVEAGGTQSAGELSEWLLRLAERHRLRSPHAAIAPLERVCAMEERGSPGWERASVALVEVLGSSGQMQRAEDLGRSLLDEIRTPENRVELVWWLGCVLFLRNRSSEGAQLLYEASSRSVDDTLRARLVAMSAICGLMTVAPNLGALASEAASTEAGRRDPVAHTLERIVQSRDHAQRLELNATRNAMDQAIAMGEREDDAARFQPLVFQCFATDERREFNDTLRFAALGRSRSSELGTPWADAFYDAASAGASLALAMIEDCAVFAESSLSVSAEYGLRAAVPHANGIAAAAAVHLGQLEKAEACIDDARAEIARSGTAGHGLCEVALAEGLLLFARGSEQAGYQHLLDSFQFLSLLAPTVSEVLIPDLMLTGLHTGRREWVAPVADVLAVTDAAWTTPFRRVVGRSVQRFAGKQRAFDPGLFVAAESIPETYARVAFQLALCQMKSPPTEVRLQVERSVTRLGMLWAAKFPTRNGKPGLGGRPRKTIVLGWEALTATERLVGKQLSEGSSNRLIARDLGVSPRTVETHVSSIRRKMQTESRTATLLAIRAHFGEAIEL
jgi:DNA-binding CsgD family transcriptional regulator